MFSEGKWFNPGGGFDPELIGNSAWLDGSSDYLTRTPSAGTTTCWIVAFWVQRHAVNTGAAQTILSAGTATGNLTWIRFDDADNLDFAVYQGSTTARKTSSAKYRDTAAWMHICVSFDSASGVTAADRIKMFVNGVEVTSLSASTSTPTDETTAFNGNVLHEIGRYSYNGGEDANVSLAQFCMIENKSFQNSDLSISDLLDSFTFGTSGSQFGPQEHSEIKTLVNTGSTNSFFLEFSEGTNLGASTSSIDNSVGSGATMPGTTGTNIGNMTSNGGLAAVFDDTHHTSSGTSANVSGTEGFAGKNWNGRSTIIDSVSIFPPDNYTGKFFRGSSEGQLRLYGSNSAPSSGTDGTLLADSGVISTTGFGSSSAFSFSSSDITTSTGYTYHWMTLTDTVSHDIYIGQLDWTATKVFNDLTPTSMAAANQSTNTPSLVYPSLNPLSATDGADMTLSEGNLKVATTTNNRTLFATQGITEGAYYFEVEVVSFATGGGSSLGIADGGFASDVYFTSVPMITSSIGMTTYDGTYYDEGGATDTNNFTGTNVVSNGDILQFAIDLDNGKFWLGKNNTWADGTTPAIDGSGATSLSWKTGNGPWFPYISRGGSYNETYKFRFSSGDFSHTPPTGFSEINSANVEPQEIQGVDGFITTLATESNIVSAVATARSDWSTNYVDILKNRSSVEAYIYRFGDDSSNEFIGDGSEDDLSTYQSTSTLSGSDNWAGHSIRIGASYLTAAGSASHSNGAATTVTHSLGTSRYCVLLFERGSSKSVWLHHPDFASGSLLEFFKDEALASSTQITTIGANSFQIGSGAATATYSYLVFADGGIASMGKYVGNGAVSGPYISMPHSSGFFARRSGGARSFWHNNSKSPGYNENGNYSRFNDPQAEGTGSLKIDMLSSAVKIRDAYADQNTSGETFYWISFGELSGGGESLPPVYGR